MNLALMGLRASGKTTLGRLAAASLARPFLDLDALTLRELFPGEPHPPAIADAWRARGEPAFRAAETRALERALARDHQVIALGGGTPTAPGAPALLRQHRESGRLRTIYLRATAETLASRLAAAGNSPDRPPLTGAGVIEEIPQVLAQRDPLYRSLADVIIDTDALSQHQVLERILAERPLPE